MLNTFFQFSETMRCRAPPKVTTADIAKCLAPAPRDVINHVINATPGVQSSLPAGGKWGAAVRHGVRRPLHSPAPGHHPLLPARPANAHQEEGGQGLWWVAK